MEDNRLIAKFMGWYISEDISEDYPDQVWLRYHNKYTSKEDNLSNCAHKGDNYETQYNERVKDLDKHFYGEFGKGRYHNSWDHLMPVIDKIESTDCSKFSYKWEDRGKSRHNFKYPEVNIQGKSCYIGFDCELDPFTEICDCYEDTKIQATYKACVKFIKWYNGNN